MRLSATRTLPVWRRDRFDAPVTAGEDAEVVLWADTFHAAFDRETLDDALSVLAAAGYRVHVARPARGRPLCCGRTFLAIGDVRRARAEMRRTLAALAPFVARGLPILGLEPSCLYTFRDELPALLPGPGAKALASRAMLFEEFVAAEARAGRFGARFRASEHPALLHGHCHQKAFGGMGAVEAALRLIPALDLRTIESSCCGMAGAFGYQAETAQVSRDMAELSLLPAVRAAPADALLVADGTSCRHQIRDGAARTAVHVARVLAAHLDGSGAPTGPARAPSGSAPAPG